MTPLEALMALWLALPTGWATAQSPSVPPQQQAAQTALLDLPDEDLMRQVEFDLASLGPLSIGTAGGGRLLNAVELQAGERWQIAPSAASWGTAETMAAVRTVIDAVHEVFPDTPPLFIGDISNRDGGRLKRHETHQSGTDVDFGFYYRPGKWGWYSPGTAANLDLPRNWALVRAMVVCADVER